MAEKIIHSEDIRFEPNSVYLLAKPNNRYIRIVTDGAGNPAYPYSENSEIEIRISQSPDGKSSDTLGKANIIVGYKPHLEFVDLGNSEYMVKMSDNIMGAIANSYKRINSPNPTKTFALGLDGKPLEINVDVSENFIVRDGVLTGSEKVLRIPKGVKKVGDNAFHSKDIDSVIIPTSVEEIGHGAFVGNHISLITLPAFCKYYGDSFDSTVIITGGKLTN